MPTLTVLQYVLGAFAGLLVGLTLGLVGGGGSILAVPLMMYLVGVDNPHIAIGTSALAVAVNAAVNLVNHARHGHVKWPCAMVFTVVGLAGALTGVVSGFFGIGGGFLVVPGLIAATQMPALIAVGSSLVAVTAFGLMTAFNYVRSGLVDWPLALSFIVGGGLGGMIGAWLASRLSQKKGTLNLLSAVVIGLTAVYMLYRSATG